MIAPPIQHAIEHRINHKAARIRLVGRRHDLPAFAETVGDQRQIGRLRQRMIKTLHAGERFRRPLKTLFRQQRRPQAVARGVADAQAFRRRAQTLAQARGLRGRGAERPHHLALVERGQLSAACGSAEHAAGRGDVPSPVIMAGRDREPDAGLYLIAEDKGQQQIGPAQPPQFGERENGRCHRRGRMNHGAQMGVAEIMDIGAGGIEEGRAQRIDALGPPDHGRLLSAGEFGKRAQRHLDRSGAAAGQRHGEEIHQRALGLMPHRRGNVIPLRRDNEVRKALGNARFVQHGFPLKTWPRASAGPRQSTTRAFGRRATKFCPMLRPTRTRPAADAGQQASLGGGRHADKFGARCAGLDAGLDADDRPRRRRRARRRLSVAPDPADRALRGRRRRRLRWRASSPSASVKPSGRPS